MRSPYSAPRDMAERARSISLHCEWSESSEAKDDGPDSEKARSWPGRARKGELGRVLALDLALTSSQRPKLGLLKTKSFNQGYTWHPPASNDLQSTRSETIWN